MYHYDAFGRRIVRSLAVLKGLLPDGAPDPERTWLREIRGVWDGDRLLREIVPLWRSVPQAEARMGLRAGELLTMTEGSAACERLRGKPAVLDHAGALVRTVLYEPGSFVPVAQLVKRRVEGEEDGEDGESLKARGLAALLGDPLLPEAAKTALREQLAGEYGTSGLRVQFFVNDHLGTPVRLVDGTTQATLWEREQDPWGNTLREWVSGSLDPDEAPTLRFQGQQFDRENGLCYNRYRFYDPGVRRYLGQDPIGVAGGWNVYAYPTNPVSWVDPLGLVVKVVAKDSKEAKILQNAYAKLNTTKRGREICKQLEDSSDTYTIRPVHKDAYYCPPGVTDPKCKGKERSVFIDPNNNIQLMEADGLKTAPKAVVLGHELGHAIGEPDGGADGLQMSNVKANENVIRQQMGVPPRVAYPVPSVIWVPGEK